MITNALITLTHQGSRHAFTTSTSRWRSRGVLLGDARDARGSVRLIAGAELDGRPVRADADGVAGRDLAPLGVLGGELDLGLGPLELELGHALDRGAGEERPVALQPQLAEEVLGRRRRRRRDRRVGRGAGRLVRRRRAAAPARRRRRSSAPPRAARESSAKTTDGYGESSTPKRSASFAIQASSSGHGRDHRAAEPLHAALEVDVRAVALEIARSRAGRDRPSRPRAPGTS